MNSGLNSKKKKWSAFVLALIVFTIFVVTYLPAIKILLKMWLYSDEYNHAFLTVLVIIYIVWGGRTFFHKGKKNLAWLGLLAVILAAPLYNFALLTEVNTLILLSLYLTILGALVYIAGIGVLVEFCTPLLLFLLLLPLPQRLLIQITSPLQLFVSRMGELITHLFSVPLYRQGNIMMLPERSFEVVEACSGLRSVVALMTLSIIMGYFMLKRLPSKWILAFASMPAAILSNIVRVVVMIYLYYYWRIDLTLGVWHSITGILVFCLALLFLFLLLNLLKWMEIRLN